MKKIAALIILTIAMMLGNPAPAAHAAIFTDVTHAGDDSGYAAPIHIICRNDGSHRWLYTGESSFMSGKACGGLGVDKIVVGYDQTVRCNNLLPPYGWRTFYTGTTEVPSYASLKCYMQRPL